MEIKGIDVSTWQGIIDWKKVEQDGIKFAILRATYGSYNVDSQFIRNIENIKNTSLGVGAYHYSYAKSVNDAKNEAENFLKTIKNYEFNYPLVFDIEDSSQVSLGKSVLTEIANTFCSTVQDAGYYACIYTNLNWINNYLDMKKLDCFDTWLAQWSLNPTYKGNFGMWQYSSSGKINGINGNVDMDISYKNYPEIINNKFQENNSSLDNILNYTVKSGDTLWSISKNLLNSGSEYNKIKNLNNLDSDTIYVGQILKIPDLNNNNNYINYEVKSGDTLWGISEKFLNSGSEYNKIKSLNNLESDIIYTGQVLKIPD